MNPEEVQAAFEAFALLEPEIQKGVAALIHKLKGNDPTAQSLLAQAQQLMAQQGTQTPK